MFPEKAVDFNSLTNKSGFWNLTIKEACEKAGLQKPKPDTMADMIFWLNMAAIAWERWNKTI